MKLRTPFAVAIAMLIAAPAARAAQTTKSAAKRKTTAAAAQRTTTAAPEPALASRALSVGGTIGVELGDIDGLALRLDGEMKLKDLTPKLSLSGVASVGYSRLTEDVLGFDNTWNIFKVIPAARFTVPVAPQVSLYGDAGLGIYYARLSSEFTILGVHHELSESDWGFLMRFGAGGFYELNPKTKLSAEISVLPYFNEVDTVTWTLGVGAMFAL